MSAANTGTPARANPSAITCNETVFPVPAAPVTRPWRFASASVSHAGASPLPMKIFSSVSAIALSDVAIVSPRRARQGFQRPGASIIWHLASLLNPVNASHGDRKPAAKPDRPALRLFATKVAMRVLARGNLAAHYAPTLALLQHSSCDRS
jgi:hypothetical protein